MPLTANSISAWLERDRFPFVLLVLALMFAGCLMPAQSDTWWQLRAGEEMWRSGSIMLHDEFTHTVAGERWPNHEWLTQIIFFGLHRLGGMALLTAFCAAAVAAAWVVVLRLAPGPALLRVAMIGAGAVLASGASSVRPQVVTMTLFAVTLWVLVRRRGIWTLPVLFLLWANLHGGVSLGGMLIVAAAAASVLLRDGYVRPLVVAGALSFVASCITPLGWSLWLEIPASLQRLQAYEVFEWRAPGLTSPIDLAFWAAGGAVIALTVIRRRTPWKSETLTLTLSALLLFALASRSARQIPPFFLCAVPAMATLMGLKAAAVRRTMPHVGLVPNAALLAVSLVGGLAFVAYAWRAPLPRLGWNPLPAETVAAVSGCEGRLYNRYDEGGYLIWFMRDRRVFMDSRQDPFSEALVMEHIRVERSGDYQALFDRYDIGCALTPEQSRLAASLRQDGWAEHPAGEAWRVFSRP